MNTNPREEAKLKDLYPTLNTASSLKTINNVPPTKFHPTPPSLESLSPIPANNTSLDTVNYCLTDNDEDFITRYLKNNPKFAKLYSKIVFDLYELIVDRIIKEWRLFQFSLIYDYYAGKKKGLRRRSSVDKNYKAEEAIKRAKLELSKNDNICDVCTEGPSHDNQILTCHGCSIQVHQDCYGVPNLDKNTKILDVNHKFFFLDELWFCRKCLFFTEFNPKCKYCVTEGGPMKMIYNSRRWGHILCVMFIKGLSFANLVFMEPIEEESKIETKNEALCYVCGQKKGRVVKCSFKICKTCYHVGCGIDDNLYFDLNNKISFCVLHDPELTIDRFSLSHKALFYLLTIKSKKEKLNNLYPTLIKQPKIRKRLPVKPFRQTFITKVRFLKPRFTEFIANRIITNDICSLDTPEIINFVIDVGMFFNVFSNRGYEVWDYGTLEDLGWYEWDQRRSILCHFNKYERFNRVGFYIRELLVINNKVAGNFGLIQGLNIDKVIDTKLDYQTRLLPLTTNTKDLSIYELVSITRQIIDDLDQGADKYKHIARELLSKYKKVRTGLKPTVKKLKPIAKNDEEAERYNYLKFEEYRSKPCYFNHFKDFNISDIITLKQTISLLRQIVKKLYDKHNLKYQQANARKSLFWLRYDAEKSKCDIVLKKLRADTQLIIFEDPVTEAIAPNYFSIVKKPMCFRDIEAKLNTDYNWQAFKRDVEIIVGNCRVYNQGVGYFLGKAERLESLMAEFDELVVDRVGLRMNAVIRKYFEDE